MYKPPLVSFACLRAHGSFEYDMCRYVLFVYLPNTFNIIAICCFVLPPILFISIASPSTDFTEKDIIFLTIILERNLTNIKLSAISIKIYIHDNLLTKSFLVGSLLVDNMVRAGLW